MMPENQDYFFQEAKKRKRKTKGKTLPTDIGTLIEKLLSNESFGQTIYLKKIRENLKEIIGELLLPYVYAESLEKGILTLKTSASVWKAELFSQKKTIIVKCNSILKLPIVKGIKFL